MESTPLGQMNSTTTTPHGILYLSCNPPGRAVPRYRRLHRLTGHNNRASPTILPKTNTLMHMPPHRTEPLGTDERKETRRCFENNTLLLPKTPKHRHQAQFQWSLKSQHASFAAPAPPQSISTDFARWCYQDASRYQPSRPSTLLTICSVGYQLLSSINQLKSLAKSCFRQVIR